MNRYQAQNILNTGPDATQDQIKAAYRRLALELHPDKNKGGDRDQEFKDITEAYNILKSQVPGTAHANTRGKKMQWGAPEGVPEQDWSKYTKSFEDDAGFWKEYERQFWQDYNKRTGEDAGFNATKQKEEPNLSVDVDESLCIGCCSCEIIAPKVFQIDKEGNFNPKSTVINQKGAGVNKILNAARTCPTKAIIVEDVDQKKRLFPY